MSTAAVREQAAVVAIEDLALEFPTYRGVIPALPFDCVADGHGCCGVADFEVGHAEALHAVELFDDTVSIVVTTKLKVGVDEIVHCVELFADVVLIVCCFGGGEIRSD